MLDYIAMTVVLLFAIQITFWVVGSLRKNNAYNQMIFLSGGKYVGVHRGIEHRHLLGDIDELGDTIYRGEESVTSSFSMVYVRLYQLYTGKCYEANLENVLQIGRVEGNAGIPFLILEDPMISKRHCLLFRRGDQIFIQDLESTNHTFVNGCQVQGTVPITHGDQLSLGSSQYQFQCYYQR